MLSNSFLKQIYSIELGENNGKIAVFKRENSRL